MPAGFPGAASPRPTRVPFVAPSLPTRTPRSTPDTRVQWPPDVSAFLPSGAAAVDVSEVDTDGDGVKEILVIYTLDRFGHGLVIRREGEAGRYQGMLARRNNHRRGFRHCRQQIESRSMGALVGRQRQAFAVR